jgi:hypothetical protein
MQCASSLEKGFGCISSLGNNLQYELENFVLVNVGNISLFGALNKVASLHPEIMSQQRYLICTI